jgi:hypothetical protein
MKYKLTVFFICFLLCGLKVQGKDYYFHPKSGNDNANGESIASPFRTLQKLKEIILEPGGRILLAAGETFNETLILDNVHGSFQNPILIDSYSPENVELARVAIIDAQGLLNGLLLLNSSHVVIRNLEITANGPKLDSEEGTMRVGVMLLANEDGRIKNISLESLKIYDVFYERPEISRSEAETRSANGTQKYGWGIRLIAETNSEIENVWIKNSTIDNVSHTGIKLTGTQSQNIRNINIINNRVFRTGGPGIQMSGVKYVHVSSNEVNYSGSNDDSRKWGRGSGLWTWSASNVLIEKNSFMNANGPGDSAGAHIDYNCDNVVLQYNFSANNAGGFCEILGNNYNCAYRYNISVNDGHRIKGENGAFQEGKIFWLSGYQGEKKERKGPVNSYFYNNTIYVKAGQVSKVAIDNRSNGLLISNNIFHLEGPVELVAGDQYKPDNLEIKTGLERAIFKNNLFLNHSNWPSEIMIQDSNPLIGSALFINPGGMKPEDYKPKNKDLVSRGIQISLITEDPFGLLYGLRMDHDFFGNTIKGDPGMGAIIYSEN